MAWFGTASRSVRSPNRSKQRRGILIHSRRWFPFFVLVALILVPAVVSAHDPNVPQGLTATSGDGDMELNWNNATNADAGYEYRYTSNQTAGVIWSIGEEADLCPTTGTPPECTWREASKKADDTDATISGLTLGTTYYFQVRLKHAAHGSNEIQKSGPSNTANALQRAKPPAVENLVATAGNAQVTLTWTHLAAYDIISYLIQREGGTGGGALTPTTEYELNDDDTEATYTVSNLVNGTEYSFQVKGHQGDVDGGKASTPSRER